MWLFASGHNWWPPCYPGVFLTTLTFVQEGSKDMLDDNLVNFRKRQKAAEVIHDIKRWQSQPHHFHPIATVLVFIEDSLNTFSDQTDIGEKFWNTSLLREPREREDEKMARLLQESGFLWVEISVGWYTKASLYQMDSYGLICYC